MALLFGALTILLVGCLLRETNRHWVRGRLVVVDEKERVVVVRVDGRCRTFRVRDSQLLQALLTLSCLPKTTPEHFRLGEKSLVSLKVPRVEFGRRYPPIYAAHLPELDFVTRHLNRHPITKRV